MWFLFCYKSVEKLKEKIEKKIKIIKVQLKNKIIKTLVSVLIKPNKFWSRKAINLIEKLHLLIYSSLSGDIN